MRIRLLGTAAGGGVPQWNCNCAVCREARLGTGRVRPRTQSSVAVSAEGDRWFLLNASPDIRWQLESAGPLHPPAHQTRGSSIEGVLLTNADLDHTLGLLLLREGEKLKVHSTAAVQQTLEEGLALSSTLWAFCGVEWIRPPQEVSLLAHRDGSRSGLAYQAIPLAGRAPRYSGAKRRALAAEGSKKMLEPPHVGCYDPVGGPASGHAVGYRIIDEQTGGRLLFLPDVGAIDEALKRELADCEALLFDGTFWSELEMQACGAGVSTAASMGHVPISGAAGSLKVLAQLKVGHRVYVHVNNTNPVLFEDSPERAAVVAGGCTVGWDGREILI